MTHPLYEYGTDDQVFFRFVNYLDVRDPAYLELYADWLLRAQEYCEERGSVFLYVITPEKSRVYREYIPSGVRTTGFITDDLVPLLEARGIHYLDLGPVLIDAKDDYQVFYRLYNAGHWSATGAFIGVRALLQRLQESYPELEVPRLEDYEAEQLLFTALPVSNYPISEEGVSYTMLSEALPAERLYDLDESLLRTRRYHTMRVFENPARADAPSLLFFTGSYFNTIDTVSPNYFSEAYHVHNYGNAFVLPYYYSLFSPDIVMIDGSDYTINQGYFPLEEMQEAFYSSPAPQEEGDLDYQELPASETLVTLEARALASLIPRDAFGPLVDNAPDVYGTGFTPASLNADGSLTLELVSPQPITNIQLEWIGPDITAAYARVGTHTYDLSLTEGVLLEAGFWTEELRRTRELTILGIDENRTLSYRVVVALT
jgi:hypothetical protein